MQDEPVQQAAPIWMGASELFNGMLNYYLRPLHLRPPRTLNFAGVATGSISEIDGYSSLIYFADCSKLPVTLFTESYVLF